jgi:hypothetical protein
VAAAALAIAGGCGITAPRRAGGEPCPAIIERAIAMRGGELRSLRRSTEMIVHFGFPGTWHLEYTFRAPHDYRWTVFTSDQPNHYLWDGQTMRAAVGAVVVGTDTSGRAPLRTHARWHAVTYLDSLCNGKLPVRFVALRSDAWSEESVLVRLTDDGSDYRLTFDRQARLRSATGPIEIPPFGSAALTQYFYDFRRAGAFLVAHGTRYEIDGVTLSEERTLSFIGNDPTITLETFRGGESPGPGRDAGAPGRSADGAVSPGG